MTGPPLASPHLNPNVLGLPPSATLAINERSARLLYEGRKAYRLGLGQSLFPVQHPVVDELRANAHQKDYSPVRGLRGLRDAFHRFNAPRRPRTRLPFATER